MTYGMKRTGELEGFHRARFCDSGSRREVRLGLAGLALAGSIVFTRF